MNFKRHIKKQRSLTSQQSLLVNRCFPTEMSPTLSAQQTTQFRRILPTGGCLYAPQKSFQLIKSTAFSITNRLNACTECWIRIGMQTVFSPNSLHAEKGEQLNPSSCAPEGAGTLPTSTPTFTLYINVRQEGA